MRKLLLLGIYWLVALSTFANTTPEKINYQGVARSADGTLLVNQKLGIQIQIRTVDSNGDVVYSEAHTVITNQYGLFSLQIGDGSVELGAFANINWENKAFLELSIDFEGGENYTSMGVSELVSVPYAMHAKTAENVFSGDFNDLVNAPANLSDFANDAGYITSANDADADATNEIQDLSLVGSTLQITNNASATAIDLSSIAGANTDAQTLTLTGTDISISGGNTIDVSSLQDGFEANTDAQSLALSGTNLSISNGNQIDLTVLQDGVNDADADATNEIQDITLTGTNLAISSGSTIDLAVLQDGVNDADADATNEIQDLSLVGSTLKITNNASATEINLAPFSGTNTDEQTLSLTGTNLFITNGNAVSLASIQDGFEANTDAQTLSLSGTDLSITGGNTVDISGLQDGFEANTDAQTLSLTGSNLSIAGGNIIDVSSLQDGFEPNTDTQTLSLVGTNLSITGGNTLDVSALQDGFEADTKLSEAEVDAFVANNGYISAEVDGSITNEIQDLELTGSTLKITNNVSATAIDLSPFAGANTDEQTLSLTGTTLSIANGNNVNLSSLQDGTGTDAQVISLTGTNLAISGGNAINIGSIDTDTKLTEAEVDAFVGNNGYLTSEADGSASNELQTLALSGANLSISSKNTVDLSGLDTDTNLSEAEVDAFVSNNGYLTSEADGSASNELQTLALSGTNLSISSKNTVDLSALQDGTGTDAQALSISGSTLSISNGNSVVLPGGGGTDDQVIDQFFLTGTGLYLSLESDGQATKLVDLSSLKDGTGTDDQIIDYFALSGSNLILSLEDDGEADKVVDLSSLKGAFKTSTTVTSNGASAGDASYATNDFVFGSYTLSQASASYNSRMYFDKSASAFRAGMASGTQWNSASVGDFSVALGYNTTANSSYSFAAGNATIASGLYASVFGYLSQATGDASFAAGQNTVATGLTSFAGGGNVSATNAYAAAFGVFSTASGNASFAQGNTAVASGDNSVAMGNSVTASGSGSFTFGEKLRALSSSSFVIGTGATSGSTILNNTNANSLLVGFNAVKSLEVTENKVSIFKAMHLNPLSSPPAGGVMGDLYVADTGKLYFHNGTAWKEVSLVP
jgi:hypothetical protein